MEEWQQLTLQGKDAFLSDAYLAAIVHHRQASILAQQQFNAVFSEQPQRALAQVLVSQFNLIDCHRELGDADACVRQFEFCLSTLNSLCGRPCSQTQQVALVTGISQVTVQWNQFLNQQVSSDLGRFVVDGKKRLKRLTHTLNELPKRIH